MVIITKDDNFSYEKNKMKKIYWLLKKWSKEYYDIHWIRSASVPLIKFKEIQTGLQIDICINEKNGLEILQSVHMGL